MLKFLIFGGNGMLAYAFKNHEYFKDHIAVDLPECDITDIVSVKNIVSKYQPEYIINCAAYTDVTKAETDFKQANHVNGSGTQNLAYAAQKHKCKLIHFSTDFVFKGDTDIEYSEDTRTDHVNNYGFSKLLGEEAIQIINPNYLIIRISWLYGPNGKNFASIISKLMQEKPELKIVSDQFGKTTYTIDVVEATINLIEKNAKGIYHFANNGVSSRYVFTKKIYKVLKEYKDFECDILPMKAEDYPDPTPRPTWSILKTDKYTQATGQKIRGWEEALEEYILSCEV